MTNDHDDERTLTRSDIAKVAVLVVSALVCVSMLVYLWGRASEDESVGSASSSSSSTTTPVESASTTISSTPITTVSSPTTTTAELQQPVATTTEAQSPANAAETLPATTIVPTAAPTAAPTTTQASTTTTQASVAIPPAAAPAPYPTSPDGTPLPLVVIFDTQTMTIAGQVPSQAARDRLSALALANSQFPDVDVIDNMVINPAVPISVGVRVIELNSARFPEGSAEILPDHARELDRVLTIMQALPNISVMVIGHADQRGDDLTNFAISDERARAVVNYLLYLGISPMRLSSRAAGESDLLTIGDDDAALALNRRTEFIFYGLLIE